jgi:hypothetical protein
MNGPFNAKLIESYDSVADSKELIDMTTWALYSVFKYYHAQQNITRDLVHSQGKNRSIFDNDSRSSQLSSEDDIDEKENKEKSKRIIDKLNLYLSDKQILPDSPRLSIGVTNKIKSLVIVLFRNNAFDIINQLDLPYYVSDYIDPALATIRDNREDVLDNWISYLMNSGNSILVDIVLLNEMKFWGNPKFTSNRLFNLYFNSKKNKIKDYEKTYDMFSHYRKEYMKLNGNVEIGKLCDIFDIGINEFDSARRRFIEEFETLIDDEGDEDLINEVIL